MRLLDIISGTIIFVFGLVTTLVIIPWQVSGSSDFGIAPDVFPRTLSWLCTGLAGLLVVTRLFAAQDEEEVHAFQAKNGLFIIAAGAFFAASFVLIQQAGFVVGGIVTLAFGLLMMGEWQHKLRFFIIATSVPVLLDTVFWRLFHIPLP